MKLRRVFAIVPDCHVPEWRYGSVWRRHFYEGLLTAGLRVTVPTGVDFGWARPPHTYDPMGSAALRERTGETLLAQILDGPEGPPDAVLSCCFSHDIHPDVPERVRATGVPWVNFFCDSAYAFDHVEELARRTSLNWFVESEAVERYRALGVPILRAPYALNPEALPDARCAAPSRTLVFVGTANRVRIRTVGLLRLAGTDIEVFGWGWKQVLDADRAVRPGKGAGLRRWGRAALRGLMRGRVGDYVADEDLVAVLRESAVVLGLNEGGVGPDAPRYLKLRDVEFPGMGCCVLTQRHADLEDVFEVGREIQVFDTVAEAAGLARSLARRPDECRAVGDRARARVVAEHTWAARLPQIEAALS